MKKYVLGLAAIVLALSFSAFRPTAQFTMKLLQQPITGGVVSNQLKWADSGQDYGICTGTQQDLACTIVADEKYTHYDATLDAEVLNTSLVPGTEPYLTITETTGITFNGQTYRKISSITASDAGNQFSFVNAKLNP